MFWRKRERREVEEKESQVVIVRIVSVTPGNGKQRKRRVNTLFSRLFVSLFYLLLTIKRTVSSREGSRQDRSEGRVGGSACRLPPPPLLPHPYVGYAKRPVEKHK